MLLLLLLLVLLLLPQVWKFESDSTLGDALSGQLGTWLTS
jgi:hypothetical protein